MTYDTVLVMLLRLRQICCHPSLIQENGVASVAPGDLDEVGDHDTRGELIRAGEIISPGFVSKMKERLKYSTLRRLAAEKEVSHLCSSDLQFSHRYSVSRRDCR